jgi:hypothetical protein
VPPRVPSGPVDVMCVVYRGRRGGRGLRSLRDAFLLWGAFGLCRLLASCVLGGALVT